MALTLHLAICLPPWLAARREIKKRPLMSEDDLRQARRSDRVFVFGSGASLKEISREEWSRIEAHDTFGFNWFVREQFARCDFHLIRQIADSEHRTDWDPQVREYCALIDSNPAYADTILLVQHELRARGANLAFQIGVFPHHHRVFPWATNREDRFSESFDAGLVHVTSTLFDSVNAAVLMGWNQIVLVGIDLYDRRYFWLPEGETRARDRAKSASHEDAHTQAASGLAERMDEWATLLAARGVALSVYNPRSLLAKTLPIYDPDKEDRRA
jgi:hypothetical protein